MKAVLVTTKHRGVFFGYVEKDANLNKKTLSLSKARMAIYFGTTKGVMQLADTGPTEKSRIGSPADIPCLHDVTAVFNVTKEAEKKWISS